VRAFLDTNVLFSGIYSSHGHPKRIIDLGVAGSVQLVTSVDVVTELTRNIARKAPHLLLAVSEVLLQAELEYVTADDADVQQYREAGFGADAPIVAAAVAAEVDYFCTGDKRLVERVRRAHLDLRAVSPAELLGLLE
jgi:predicted nucleic acid-binding protein